MRKEIEECAALSGGIEQIPRCTSTQGSVVYNRISWAWSSWARHFFSNRQKFRRNGKIEVQDFRGILPESQFPASMA